jgi:hypothetical protein
VDTWPFGPGPAGAGSAAQLGDPACSGFLARSPVRCSRLFRAENPPAPRRGGMLRRPGRAPARAVEACRPPIVKRAGLCSAGSVLSCPLGADPIGVIASAIAARSKHEGRRGQGGTPTAKPLRPGRHRRPPCAIICLLLIVPARRTTQAPPPSARSAGTKLYASATEMRPRFDRILR